MRNQKAFAPIAVIIALAVLVVVGGGVILQKKVWPPPLQQPTTAITQKLVQATQTPFPTQPQYQTECPEGWVPIYEGGEFSGCEKGTYLNQEQEENNGVLLQKCLDEARRQFCKENNLQLDDYGNCVGLDFVDPQGWEKIYQPCYDSYGAKPSTVTPQTNRQQAAQCPQPYDENGPLFQVAYGKLIRLEITEGGRGFVVIQAPYAAGPQSFNITIASEAAAKLESVPEGTQITLYGYVRSSLSGANPGYSCVEF